MKNNLFIIIILYLITSCTNDIIGHRAMSYYYEGNFIEHNISTTCEVINIDYNKSEYTDTIFVPDSTFELLISVFNLNNPKPFCSSFPDCYGVLEYNGKKLYLDKWYNVIKNNKMLVKGDDISYWRYTIRCLGGFYNDFSNYRELFTEPDINNYGIPKDFKEKKAPDPFVPVLCKEIKRKILIVEK